MKIRSLYGATIVFTLSMISVHPGAFADDNIPSFNPANFSQLNAIQSSVEDSSAVGLSVDKARNREAIKSMLTTIEGPEITYEADGNYTRWGIGDGNSAGLHPQNVSQAASMFYDRYIEHSPFQFCKPVMDAMEKLGPDAVYAWGQLVLHRPAWANKYARAWSESGVSFESKKFVDYFLRRQALDYKAKTKRPRYLVGFMKRVRLAREGGYSGGFALGDDANTDVPAARRALERERTRAGTCLGSQLCTASTDDNSASQELSFVKQSRQTPSWEARGH